MGVLGLLMLSNLVEEEIYSELKLNIEKNCGYQRTYHP